MMEPRGERANGSERGGSAPERTEVCLGALRWILLGVVIALLTLSVLVAQTAFRFERTVMSYRFTYRALQEILEPLDDPVLHGQTVDQAFRDMRRSYSLQIPRELEPHVVDAAAIGFSAARLRQTTNRWLISIQQVLHGRSDTLELPLSLVPFRDAFLSSVSGRFPPAETAQIRAVINNIPPTIQLADELPDDLRNRILAVGRSMTLVQIVLQYIVPGLLIIACFFHGRIGTGIAATGIAFLAAGLPSLVVVYLRADALAVSARHLIARSIPSYLSWMLPPLRDTAAELIRTGRTTAMLVTLYGVAATLIGGYLFAKKGDPRIDLTRR